jgi:hypothetical protein
MAMRVAVQSQRAGDVESFSSRRRFAVIFQKSQPAEAATVSLPASMGPLKT